MGERTEPAERYDVAILGGGLAGLDAGPAAQAGAPGDHASSSPRSAVGPRPRRPSRSASRRVELSCNYFGEVLGMKDHLEQDADPQVRPALLVPRRRQQRPRPARRARARRSTPGARATSSTGAASRTTSPSGTSQAGIDVVDGCHVEDVEIGDERHLVTVDPRRRGSRRRQARWVVDASGPRVHPQAQARPARGQRPRSSTRPGSASPAASTSRSGPTPTTRSSSGACPSAACAGSAPTTSAARATGSG